MKGIRKFLKEEIQKPIRALRLCIVAGLKFLALAALRFVLWSFFFFLPFVAFFLFAFHWATERARSEIEKMRTPAQFESSVTRPVRTPTSLFELRALSQDFRFWLRELERLRRK